MSLCELKYISKYRLAIGFELKKMGSLLISGRSAFLKFLPNDYSVIPRHVQLIWLLPQCDQKFLAECHLRK